MKIYKCECGRTFTDPQSFNGHKGQCLVHLGPEKLKQANENRKRASRETGKILKERYNLIKEEKLKQWVSEQHKCERCGKVMTKKWGKGRFCSKSCCKSHPKTPEQRIAISERARGRKLTEEEIKELFRPKVKRVRYDGPELPGIDKIKQKPGYKNSHQMSYAEQFWKKVLDNNQIEYEQEFFIQKPKGDVGVFRLDFKIGNIDLEIDGRMHKKEEVREKDDRRDKYIESLGYIIYRIPWINPNTEPHKILVNKQIEDFLNFINQI